MKSLTREQLDALLDTAKAGSMTDYLMFLVTFQHGLRVSETLSLTKDNIRDGYITVKRGKSSHRCEHPLLPNEVEHLTKLEGKFFDISRWTFNRRMQGYCEKAGIPRHLAHAHTLKHSCGRLGFKGGMTVPDLVEWLGHKNPANSLIYAKSDISTAFAAFKIAIAPKADAATAGR